MAYFCSYILFTLDCPSKLNSYPILTLSCHNHKGIKRPVFEVHDRLVSLYVVLIASHLEKLLQFCQERSKTMDDELLTVKEVAHRLRVDESTVRRWVKSGILEAITLPHQGTRKQFRIRKSTLDTLFNPIQPEQQDAQTSVQRR